MNHNDTISLVANETLTAYQRVKLVSSSGLKAAVAGANDVGIGVVLADCASGNDCDVHHAGAVSYMVASEAIPESRAVAPAPLGKIRAAGGATAQVETFTTRADATDDLDGTFFVLYDEDGSVGVWIDVDDGGTTIPAGAAALSRAIEVTGVVTDDTAADVATAVASAINADSKFVSSGSGAVVTVTHATAGAVADGEDGDATFTAFVTTVNGVNSADAIGFALQAATASGDIIRVLAV